MNEPFSRHIRDLAYIPRWTIVRTLRQQSVAEHSYFVTVYAMQILDILSEDGYEVDFGLWSGTINYAIQHDWDEIVTGDIPGPHKRTIKQDGAWINESLRERNVWLRGIPMGLEINIVKCADYAESLAFLMEEQQMGNQNLKSNIDDATRLYYEAWAKLPWTDVDESWAKWGSRIFTEEARQPIAIK